MRVVGNSQIALPQLTPSSAALQQAATHQATAMALMRVASSGVRKGIYRYASHEAANRASEEAQVVAMLLNMPPIASTS
ncbi:MAG: hypothetical protein IPF55_08240 [Rhodoferax sp.]|nr:hypothetical protein [Rhodoferax sp.]